MFKSHSEHALTVSFKGPKSGPCGSTRAAVAVASALRNSKGCKGASVNPGERGHDLVVVARFKTAVALSSGFQRAKQALLIEEAREHLNCRVGVKKTYGLGG